MSFRSTERQTPNTIDRRIAKQKERPPASKTRKSAVKIKSRGLKGRTPTAEERRIANALGALPCIACYMGVVSENGKNRTLR
ncbi:TPA: hypothetical protein L6K68_005368, partial [Escherichia coli]|nr:hypothetical protein [Escherichia coli]